MKKSSNAQSGFTLIEILISMTVLALVIAAFISVVVISTRSFRASRARYLAIKIAEEGIELVINKRDNNVLCVKPGSCSQICDWKQGLLNFPGGSTNCNNLKSENWNVDSTKPDQLLVGNWFDNYSSSSRICIKSAFQNKFGICSGAEIPLAGNYNRKVTINKLNNFPAVDVISTVTWTINGSQQNVILQEILFGLP